MGLNHLPLLGQAWPRAIGDFYAKLSYGTSTGSEQFAFDGQTKLYADNVTEDAFFDRSIYSYIEYGLTNNITVVGGVPFKRIILRDAAFRYRTFGFGSAQIGARYGLKSLFGLESAHLDALAITGLFTIPLGYTRNYTPSTGSGQVDVDLSFSYGHSFYPIDAYLQVGAGYRYRSSVYSFSSSIPCQEGVDKDCFADRQPSYGDDLNGSVEAGFKPTPWLFMNLAARTSWSVKEPNEGFSVTNPIPTRQRVVKLGGTLAVMPVEALGLSSQLFFTPYGRNTVNSIDLFLGIDYHLNFIGGTAP